MFVCINLLICLCQHCIRICGDGTAAGPTFEVQLVAIQPFTANADEFSAAVAAEIGSQPRNGRFSTARLS